MYFFSPLSDLHKAEEWQVWKTSNYIPLGSASTAGAIMQHMAYRRLLKICFTEVSDISTTISLIDVLKYAPSVCELEIPAVMYCKIVIPVSRNSHHLRLSVLISSMRYCLEAFE